MGSSDQYVLFTLDDQRYMVPLTSVERVVLAVYVTPVPHAPEVVDGVISIQGQIVPVINLRRRFHLTRRILEPTDQFVIVKTSQRTVALVVDSVVGVLAIPRQTFVPRDDFLPVLEHVAGTVQLDDGIIFIHDLEACLSLAEEQALDHALQAA